MGWLGRLGCQQVVHPTGEDGGADPEACEGAPQRGDVGPPELEADAFPVKCDYGEAAGGPEACVRWTGRGSFSLLYPAHLSQALPRMFGLDITPLKPGLHTLDEAPTAEDLELDPAAFRDLGVRADLDVQPEQVLVTLRVRATATLECDRTLEPFDQPVSGTHTVLFLSPERLEGFDADGDDDVRPLPEPGVPLDLTESVRDTLLLALPSRRVAPGAEDEEIPLAFGVATDADGDPVDPRWEALRRLRSDEG